MRVTKRGKFSKEGVDRVNGAIILGRSSAGTGGCHGRDCSSEARVRQKAISCRIAGCGEVQLRRLPKGRGGIRARHGRRQNRRGRRVRCRRIK